MPSSKGRDRCPVAVSKYLLPHEVRVAVVRRHPGMLLVPMADAVGAVAIALALTGTLAHSSSLKLVIWVPTAFLVGQFLWTAIGRPADYFVVTNERVLLISGMLRRKVSMIPLGQLVNMNFERSFFGRLLGFGSLIDGSGGRDRVICEHVPYPEQIYLQICGMLFPASVDQGDDDHSTGPDLDLS
jgi:Bacterial PH domain